MRIRIWFLVLASMALGACATSSPQGRLQLTVPAPISAVYSEANMRLHLVTDADIDSPCSGMECRFNRAFDQRVLRLGTRLAQSAFAAYPDLAERIGRFEIVIAEKAEPGSASSAAGTIVIFRGVQKLHLDEEALAFLIAREMGHVIGRHHDENSSASILFSVLAQLMFPVAGLISGSATLVQTASATTAATSTAASFIGSKLMMESYKEDQLREGDAIALDLLARQGWREDEIANALKPGTQVAGENRWSKDLRTSAGRIAGIAEN